MGLENLSIRFSLENLESEKLDELLKIVNRSEKLLRPKYEKMQEEIFDNAADMSDAAKIVKNQMTEIKSIEIATRSALGLSTQGAIESVGLLALEKHNSLVSRRGQISINFQKMTKEELHSVLETKIGGKLLSEHYEEIFSKRVIDKLNEHLSANYIAGKGFAPTVKDLSWFTEMGGVKRHQTVTLARTHFNEVANNARMKVYQANSDLIEYMRFDAVIDNNTSIQCAALDQRTWKINDPSIIKPPLHPRCRSVLLPYFGSVKKLGLSRERLEADYESARLWYLRQQRKKGIDVGGRKIITKGTFKGSMKDWYFQQEKATQVQMVGVNRHKLLAENKISFDQLIDKNGNRRTLKQLNEIIDN